MDKIFVKIYEDGQEIDNCYLPAVPQKDSLFIIPTEEKVYLIERVDFVLDRKIRNGSAFFDHVHLKVVKLSK